MIPSPQLRPRRLRRNAVLRGLARQTRIHPSCLVMPLFLAERDDVRVEVESMPGIFQTGIDEMRHDIDEALADGVRSFMVYGIPDLKDAEGSEAWNDEGIVQRALRIVRAEYGNDVGLFADTCFCEYTAHGHCGVIGETSYGETRVLNDRTLHNLAKTAISQARAGADFVSPSGMIDGQVAAIRDALDTAGLTDAAICAHSVKYASSLYGPFREAAESAAPSHGDRRSLQMDPGNALEALRETTLDEDEGADVLLIKPAIACLDIIRRVSHATTIPVAASMVSGEYAMIKAAADRGWIDGDKVMWEHHLAIRRAGARIIVTYAARDVARMAQREN